MECGGFQILTGTRRVGCKSAIEKKKNQTSQTLCCPQKNRKTTKEIADGRGGGYRRDRPGKGGGLGSSGPTPSACRIPSGLTVLSAPFLREVCL